MGKNMRGADVMQEGLFSFKRLEEFVPADHPLRDVRKIFNAALARLDAKFNDMYALLLSVHLEHLRVVEE